MSSINVCTFSGRLGKDAETRYTPSQKAITNFSVAVDIGWGEKKRTMWLNCGLWGERGEKIAQYLTKGLAVTVTGDIELREYESNGAMKQSLSLNVRDVDIQSKIEKPQQQYTGGFREPAASKPQVPAQQGNFDDDIPF